MPYNPDSEDALELATMALFESLDWQQPGNIDFLLVSQLWVTGDIERILEAAELSDEGPGWTGPGSGCLRGRFRQPPAGSLQRGTLYGQG